MRFLIIIFWIGNILFFLNSCSYRPIENNLILQSKLLVEILKNNPIDTGNGNSPATPDSTTDNTPENPPTTEEPSPQNPASPPPNTSRIYADQGWQQTDFHSQEDKSYLLSASGNWSMTSIEKYFSAEGLESNPSFFGDYRYDKDFNHGALLCRLDTKPEVHFSIGSVQADRIGILQCRINDTDFDNNEGYIDVKWQLN